MTFTDCEYSMRKRKTKRDEFLACMDEITPWEEFVALIQPYYYNNKLGRKPRGIETMLYCIIEMKEHEIDSKGVEIYVADKNK